MRLKILHVFLFLLLLLLSTNGKNVKTTLFANWKQTSILAEISEYLGKDNDAKFWKFVDLANEKGKIGSPGKEYETGISIAEKLIPSSEMGLLKLSMSMRTMSPQIEVHRRLGQSYARGCFPFFVIREKTSCLLDDLKFEDNEVNEQEISDFDHIYPPGSNASKTIVIYGEIGTRELANLIDHIKVMVLLEKDVRFVLRHFKPSATDDSLISLSGYGVELAIKNTEYNARDVSKEKAPENLHGLNFAKLLERQSEKAKELNSLREFLEKRGEIVPLQPWQLHDLEFKTCQKIIQEMDLEETERMLHDFPLHARVISHAQLNETLQKEIKKTQTKLEKRGIDGGENVLAINGRIVSTQGKNIDVFSLVDTVKEEKRAVDELANIGFPPETDFYRLLTSVDLSPIDSSAHAFDYRGANPVFINDLEASSFRMYTSLMLLLQPFPSPLRPISRNIFTLVLFSDPFSTEDIVFDMMNNMKSQGAHIRFGFVPIFNEKKHGMTIKEAVESKKMPYEKKSLWTTKEGLLSSIQIGNEFLKKSGFPVSPIALLNGYPLDLSQENNFFQTLFTSIEVQTTRLQSLLFSGQLEDDVNISNWWIDKDSNEHVVSRANNLIIEAFKKRHFVGPDVIDDQKYFSKSKSIISKNAEVTTWIVGDFNDHKIREFAVEVLNSKAVEYKNKVALVSNQKNDVECASDSNTLILEEVEDVDDLIEALTNEKCTQFCSKHNPKLARQMVGGAPGETFVVSNGLVIGPFAPEDLLVSEDFEYLDSIWRNKKADKAREMLEGMIDSDVSLKFYSTISKIGDVKRADFGEFSYPKSKNAAVFQPADEAKPSITITWIANPVSRDAQHIISIVKLISRAVNSKVQIIFNPRGALSEMPIRRFYRFVASEELEFKEDGAVEEHFALFQNLPQKQLLTMSVLTNDAWMIEVKRAEHDLDNIMLDNSDGDVEGVFHLEHILVEGQAMTTDGNVAPGLELELKSEEKCYDTISMLNLGYFQLKGEPGIWNLLLRNGSTTQNHKIVEVDSAKILDKTTTIVINSFTGKWTKIKVEKLSSSTEELDDSEASPIGNFWNSAKNLFSSNSAEDPREVINVFSLASGHLYERFLRIMMVSVMKRTEAKRVKFWLLKNYLSPKFKETISKMAEHYGFEYEFVEYKWPKWLHQQTEKQRIMWGYKILFLDVLFPLNVDKIIFVDADQVVRADLLELMDYDLNGAPYGYTPFCNSRRDMDGFRFWREGYWRNHLRGRSYHISALYVVDLKAFRLKSTGDRLRGRYAQLSMDPNSLSNLDQDLPNSMIHEIPIASLPQEWLWCETWCDDESKAKAKTIDLCNNPKTKESKLDSAKRIIGEWKELDEEISDVFEGRINDSNMKSEL